MRRLKSNRLPIRYDLVANVGTLMDSYYVTKVQWNRAIKLIRSQNLTRINRSFYVSVDQNSAISAMLVLTAEFGIYMNYNRTIIMNLPEMRRSEILKLSRVDTKERYKNRTSVSNEKFVTFIDTKELNKGIIVFRVKFGGNYVTSVEFDHTLLNDIKNSATFNRKTVYTKLLSAFNRSDLKVDCTCPDFGYRFAYVATQKGFKSGTPENRPAKKTNPSNIGAGCKHVIRLLSNGAWLVKAATKLTRALVTHPDLLK